jgi:alkylation response protein AidB-like acyl-CoA dehydrogenase
MDVRLSPEQEALRDSAAQIVARFGPKAVGQIADPERRARLDAAVDESGWRELRGATGAGMPLASGVEPALVAEELGRGLADVSFLGPTLAAELRRIAGAPPARSGETVGLDAGLGSLARAGEPGAAPMVAIDSAGCDSALFLVPDSDGYRVARVELGPTRSGLDLTRPSVILRSFSPLPLGEGSQRLVTADDITRWTALGLTLASADLTGVMRGAVELACAYAKERTQYGQPIGSFQAVQHMLADAFAAMEGARSITLHAAWAVDVLPAPDALAAAAAAKAYSARAARDVCETVIQVHGGIGNTWECLAHVFLRRALLSGDICGDANVNLGRVLQYHAIGGDDGFR